MALREIVSAHEVGTLAVHAESLTERNPHPG
jgi:hypothetical protein